MANVVERVADFVREQGRQSNTAISISEIAAKLGLSRSAVESARSAAIRRYDDIYPCATAMLIYEPGWKESHPEAWSVAQARSQSARKHRPPIVKDVGRKDRARLPNIIGPVTSIYNVVAVNVHPDHVSIQHEDGTWTELTGTVKIKAGGKHGS
jgi:hypothetical protein